MQAYWTLTRRELAGFFFSITGYVIIAAAALLIGFSFVLLLVKLQAEPTPMPLTEVFYETVFFWIILLLVAPVITMRLFALEKFSGTFETLMTTPVSDVQVVAAKFTAAIVFYTVTWLPLLVCILILRHYTSEAIDAAGLGSAFLGIFLFGCMLVSFGCFASALTRSQMVAAMISVLFSVGLLVLSFLPEKVPGAGWQAQTLACFALRDHMRDFVRGVVDTRPVVLYLSITFLFLFLTLRVIESRRWK